MATDEWVEDGLSEDEIRRMVDVSDPDRFRRNHHKFGLDGWETAPEIVFSLAGIAFGIAFVSLPALLAWMIWKSTLVVAIAAIGAASAIVVQAVHAAAARVSTAIEWRMTYAADLELELDRRRRAFHRRIAHSLLEAIRRA
jgi:hypothetical protein